MANARGLKKLLSGILTAVMTLSLTVASGSVSKGVFEPTKVKAATSGVWERSPSADQIYNDQVGQEQIYEGIENGMVKFTFLMSSGNASHKSELYCTDAPKSVANGETFKITLKTIIVEVTHEFYGPPNSWVHDGGSAITDSNNRYMPFWKTGVDPKTQKEDSVVVEVKFPVDAKDGDTKTLTWHTDNVDYIWTYTYKSGGTSSDDGDATTIGEDSDDEDDIVVGQVQNVKLTNKKVKRIYISYNAVSDAAGYQIRYSTNSSMSGAKKMNATVVKGYFKNAKGKKATFKKGKTYYVQVRAYAKDSDGNNVYGAWSAKKSVKIKK